MRLARYLRFAGIVIVGGLLTLVEGPAQERQLVAGMTPANGNHQLENFDQPKDVSRSALEGARVTLTAAKNSDEDAAHVSQPGSEADTLPAKPVLMPEALLLPSADQLSPLESAYLDAFSILSRDNTCSRFYGGSRVIEVLNELKRQLKTTYLDTRIAVRMSGSTMSVTSLRYGFSYRLFDKAELNLRGSFYRGNALVNHETVPSVGSFLPNTREGRVAILLHELGHLVEKSHQTWLLPNDGNDQLLSHKNTLQIIAVCGEQIKQLHYTSFETELQAARLSSGGPAVQASNQQ